MASSYATLHVMADLAHYGDTILIASLLKDSPATKLQRISFVQGSERQKYDEIWLQDLVMRHPGLLPVAQVEPVFDDMVPVCRELPLKAGYVDNVFVTPNGDIAIVECKLWRNPEARRKVIAQIVDYASELSTLSYEAFESAVLRAQLTRQATSEEKRTLFHMVSAGEERDEAAFHDAVTRTLRRGRILLIIVGDGIREGLESMAEFLQKHAGLHFRLCLVELAIFQLPGPEGGVIAQSRILGGTTNIERGIVVLNDSRLEVRPPDVRHGGAALASTISSESFYESLDSAAPGTKANLQAFLAEIEPRGVKPDITAKTLTLRWTKDSGSWNLGTISKKGELWMDYHGQQAWNLNLTDESHRYLESLAKITPAAYVAPLGSGAGWNLRKAGPGFLSVSELLSDTGRKIWLAAIIAFQHDVLSKQQD